MNGKNCHHSPRATLAAVGLKLQALQLLAPIREKVKIAQKKIKHEPLDKLQDALITILAGAHGLCEINTRLRADQALQRAFSIKSTGCLRGAIRSTAKTSLAFARKGWPKQSSIG
jgi:hypothetical protein